MAQPAAVLSILLTANTKGASTGILRVNQQLSATQGSARKAGAALGSFAKIASVGVGVGLGYAVKKAADFEQQLDSLGSVADATGRQMERLRKQAMKAGADTKFSALEAAKAQTELAKGGLKVQQILDGGLNASLALAAAGEMDLALAASTSANAMNLFGLKGKDAMKVADQLATAANATTADVEDFAVALKMGGSVAKMAGLSFGETVLALEALAKVGIRNSDAGTSLKSSIIQLLKPTEKQANLAKKLNLEFVDQQGNMKSMADISAMLRDELGGMTAAQRTATLATLAGTDGVRTLSALYDAGPARLDKWAKGLGKTGTAAEVAAKKQDNLKGKLENLKGSIETAAIALGSKMLPALTKAAERVTKILNDPKLTSAEKFTKLAEMAGEAFSKALPIIADKAAQAAPVVAKAFVTGFLSAGVWGRLAVAGFLLTKMGGPPAFLQAGRDAGKAMGVGMGAGVAAGSSVGAAVGAAAAKQTITWTRGPGGALLAQVGTSMGQSAGPAMGAATGAATGAAVVPALSKSGLKGKLAGLFRSWGPTLGIVLAASFGPEFAKKAREGLSSTDLKFDLPKHLTEPIGALIGPLGTLEGKFSDLFESGDKLRTFGDTAEAALKKASKAADSRKLSAMAMQARALAREFPKSAGALSRFADAAEEAARRAAGSFRNLSNLGGKSLKQIKTAAANTAFDIQNRLGWGSEAAKKALAKNFAGAARAVRKSMQAGVISTKEGTRLIEQYMVQALRNMGFSQKQALALRKRAPGSSQMPGADGGLRPTQRGAYIADGKAHGDSVPALLERGEYVLNRKAVRKVGRGALDRLNYAQAPRFQGGGIVEMLHPGNDPKGHGDHLHVAMSTYGAIVALGRKLQKLGWLVGEHPAFGGVGGGHSPTGYHYTGQAIDVNWPDAGQEAAKIRALLPLLGGGLGAVAPKIARVLVGGPDSPLKALVQSALDTTRAGAQATVDRMGASTEGAESGGGNMSGNGSALMKSIAAARGWSFADWWTLDGRETSHGRNLLNPSSGAFNRAQFMPGITEGQYGPGSRKGATMAEQIQSMAQYIAERYGNTTAALRFHDAHNWYSKGGMAGMAAGGLAGRFGRTLKKVRGGKSAKIRKTAVDRLMKRIRGVGLPGGIEKNLKTFSKDAGVFGEYADRASMLTTDNAAGNPVGGVVNGKTQVQWLGQQLGALFQWRNAMIRAEEIVVARREMIAKLIARAKKRMRVVNAQLRTLGKKPKQNRLAIRALTREKGALTRIVGDGSSGLKAKRAGLGTLRGDLLTNLQDVQGIGSPMGVLKSLPPAGVLGGSILQVQTTLRDLNAPRPTITDTSDTGGDSERTSILEQLLRESNLRTAVSERQFKVFRDMPQFATGGVVPGRGGQAVPAMVHGGEGVFTRDQMAAMGGAPNVNVTVIVKDGAVDPKKIETVVEKKLFDTSRRAGRGMPGRGGGGLHG